MSKPRATIEIPICLVVCLLFSVTRARADAGTATKPSGAPAPGRVTGHVFRSAGSPVVGRIVHLNGRRMVTLDKEGAFVLEQVPARYDLWIGHDKEASVTVYRGLTRRAPTLQHEASYDLPEDRRSDNKATISGIVRGGFPFPIDKDRRLVFSFMSEDAHGGWGMGSRMGQDGNSLGPRFGRMNIVWQGKPRVAGTLIAIGARMEKGNFWLDPVLGVQPVVINDKAETTVEIELASLPTGRIAGEVKAPAKYRTWNGYLDFRLDGGRGSINLDCRLDDAWRTQGRFDCLVPDLSVLHGQYCMSLIDGTAHGSALEHCGGSVGMTDFSPPFQAPPDLRPLDKPGLVRTRSVIAWSGEEKAVYAVEIRSSMDYEARTPENVKSVELRLFTTGTRMAWKELERYGVKTPPGAKYEVVVSRMWPYRTVDEIASASGPLSRTATYQRASSTPVEVKVVE
jgi:hypothetical protein